MSCRDETFWTCDLPAADAMLRHGFVLPSHRMDGDSRSSLPRYLPMTVEALHAAISLAFLAAWAMISHIVVRAKSG